MESHVMIQMTEIDLFNANIKYGAIRRLLPSKVADCVRTLSKIQDGDSIRYNQINQSIAHMNENISDSNETANFVKLFDEETDWNISYDNLNLLGRIAQGSFGVVYRASVEDMKETIAVKVQDVSENNSEEQINLLVEITCAKYFSHENLVKCVGIGRTQPHPQQQNIRPKVFIALEYYERGTLREVLQSKLSWRNKLLMAKDIASGLACIHGNNLIHRDIKTENILVNNRFRASICDFSFICHRRSSSKSQYTYGTDDFMSPEIALAADYDMASDIFSFGIVICELITGIPPSKTFMCRQPRNTFALDEEEVGRHVPLDCPEGLEALAYQCCDIDPKKRPTAAMCVEEIELIAIELRIDEYESKTRTKDSNISQVLSTPAAAKVSDSVNVQQLQQEFAEKSDLFPAEDAEIESKLYLDIKSKLATIECDGEEAEEQSNGQQISSTQESEGLKVLDGGDIDITASIYNNDVDSHIEEKLKPMLQTMLGRLESIEQNLQRNVAPTTGMNTMNNQNITKSNGDSANNQNQENCDFVNASVLSTTDGKENQELAGITALQAQIDELKAAMESMSVSAKLHSSPQSIFSGKTSGDEMSRSMSTGKHRKGVQQAVPESIQSLNSMSLEWNDAVVQGSGKYSITSSGLQSQSEDYMHKAAEQKGRGKWSVFFQEMNLNTPSLPSKISRSFDSAEISSNNFNSLPVARSERLKTHSIEFNEQHFMHQSKQFPDDISIEPPHISEKPSSRMNGMQIVEHVAYTIDKQPLHVTEKLFPPRSSQKDLNNSGPRKPNHASEQLSKALGSFLDVISRCNETSTAAMEAVNSVDDAVLGMKSPVVPSVRFVPINSSSSKNYENMQMVEVDQDSIPIYPKSNIESTTTSSPRGISIDTSNNYDSQMRERYLTHQQPHRTSISFHQPDTSQQHVHAYLAENSNHHLRKRYSVHMPQSLQSPTSSTQVNNGSKQRKQSTPHYATSTKSKSISSPRIQHNINDYQNQQHQRSSSSPSRSRNSAFKSPMSASLDLSGSGGRLRNQVDWASKEALSTRKSPFAYSFPSDSKPRLSFEATAGTSRQKSPTNMRRPSNGDLFPGANLSTKSSSSVLPLSAALQRR